MAKAKQKSGGARATETRQAKRKKQRPADYEAECIAELEALGAPPLNDAVAAISWHARLLLITQWRAARDPGLPPEVRRTQIAAIAPQLHKALEPARLSMRLEELERAKAELEAQLEERSSSGAAAFDSPEGGGARPPAALS